MYELKNGKPVSLSPEEEKAVSESVFHKVDKNYHYLAFDRQLYGFCTIDGYVTINNPSLKEETEDIFKGLLARREVCSLFKRNINLTLYPLIERNLPDYKIDLENIDKHFEDILELNDEKYETKYLFVDFGHGASNLDKKLILTKLNWLLENSKGLKKIYIEDNLSR